MSDFKVFEKAKQAQEAAAAAAAKAKELAGQAPDLSELREKAGGVATQIREQATGKITEAMDSGFAKVTGVLDDLNAALPVLQEAGYPVDLIEIELGLSPKIAVRFATKLGVKEERLNELLAEHAQHKMTIMLLHSLEKAKAMQKKIRLGGLKPKGIEIQIGVFPEVALRFG